MGGSAGREWERWEEGRWNTEGSSPATRSVSKSGERDGLGGAARGWRGEQGEQEGAKMWRGERGGEGGERGEGDAEWTEQQPQTT